jgi:UDP-N-acetylmuramate: L-alanyl-gamma-D-glutamyl-meso-diaminopimelate ligase
LATFKNVKRRMELRAELAFRDGSVAIYDDFAHHPSAIATTLEGLRTRLDRDPVTAGSRIVAVFEPRSNTMKIGTMKAQLPAALACADLAICHTGGLTWDAAEALQPMGDKAVCANDIDTTVAVLMAHLLPGDQIVCMSNGGFGGIHERLKTAIQAAQALSQA